MHRKRIREKDVNMNKNEQLNRLIAYSHKPPLQKINKKINYLYSRHTHTYRGNEYIVCYVRVFLIIYVLIDLC